MFLILESTSKSHLESHTWSWKTLRRPILKWNNLAKLWLIYNNNYETLSTINKSSFNTGSWKTGETLRANESFKFVREIPYRPTGHVETRAQGETLNSQNTTTMPRNRASIKQTPGAKAPWRATNFEQEPKRTQTRGRQPMGPQPDVERPQNIERAIRTLPPCPPLHSHDTRPRKLVKGKRPATRNEGIVEDITLKPKAMRSDE
uniref:Uncharacterized protein n=1 Tax=Cannabis sativa TaxID=3483 RepID=A0A803NKF9_CANSA